MSDQLRELLSALGRTVADRVVAGRDQSSAAELATVSEHAEADVIYGIDRFGEDGVLDWFREHWPGDQPVRIVMEGIDDDQLVVEPAGAARETVRWLCIIDPIDGTRGLMYDKRAAWVLAGLAPSTLDEEGRPSARLDQIEVAAMTEIPTTKQWRADQYCAIRGAGIGGIVASGRGGPESIDLHPRPSGATGLEHGFASFAHFFPDGMARLAAIEQRVWDELMPPADQPRQIFEDQYLCNGGQLHEVLVGHDRFVADLRPLVADPGRPGALLASHPYDICTALVLTEAGGIVEDPWGRPLTSPLDTTTPVSWVAYANRDLAHLIRPALRRALTAEGIQPT